MHRSLKRLLGVTVMAAALPLGLLAATASSASAYTLDNTDPSATGCWDSKAYVAAQASLYDQYGDYFGYVDNWYSPDCGTNWSETFVAGGSAATVTVYATRGTYSTDHYTTYYSYAWSNQVYAPTTTACAWGQITVGSHHAGNAACA